MNKESQQNKLTLSYLLRKYPTLRMLCWILFGGIVFSILSIISLYSKHIPYIESIYPSVGSPGDIVILHGSHFGSMTDNGYVEIGKERLTSSSYLLWTKDEIKIVLPANVQDGLVTVTVGGKTSQPVMFANQANIPTMVRNNPKTTVPVIDTISPTIANVGQLLTLVGSNFGDSRGTSSVVFKTKYETLANDGFSSERISVAANAANFDYEYWTDSEIRVRVPDGAISGTIYVKTSKGTSPVQKIQINDTYGTKTFSEGRSYVLQIATDISNAQSTDDSSLTLHIPRPIITSTQPVVEMTESIPTPVLQNYRNTVIHQVRFADFENNKKRFTHNFMVSVYAVSTQINTAKVAGFSNKKRLLYTTYTQPDTIIPSNSQSIQKLSSTIVKKDKNPYRQAKSIYDYMLDNFTLQSRIRSGDISPLDLLTDKQGDAYDFAIIYTALLRSLGIPAKVMSGIFVDVNMLTHNHWWCEFYIENYGWVPVDPALGAGLSYKMFKPLQNARQYYFGNIDSQHIIFSETWNAIKPALVNNKTVYRPRSYALQSIWEEATAGADRYSSFWNAPAILGVY
ncbi:MAG: IPT/TIG domain-containing protein [Treponema sp.]|nr:IPT/TIG domain-containing protein [Treponema sp.]